MPKNQKPNQPKSNELDKKSEVSPKEKKVEFWTFIREHQLIPAAIGAVLAIIGIICTWYLWKRHLCIRHYNSNDNRIPSRYGIN